MSGHQITFERVRRDHLPMLARWMREPHNAVDDDPGEQLAAIEGDMDGGRFEMWIGRVDGAPLAYLQDCAAADAWEADEWFADAPPGTRTMGLFIGPASALGRGHAAPLVRAFCDRLAARGARAVMLGTAEGNLRARRAFRRAGLREVGRAASDGVPHVLFQAPLPMPRLRPP